jgi:hypothetical protein
MTKGNYIIKATDFNYPTRKELKEIRKDSPSIGNFGFSYISEISAFLIKSRWRTLLKKSSPLVGYVSY